MAHPRLAVVGLGVIGACATYAAARAGMRVLALDAGVPGEGTSGTSFAWVNAVRKEPEVYHRLNAEGMAAHVALARELGVDAGFHPGGSLEWAEAEDDARELSERVERLARRGYAACWVSRERARAMEPALAVPERVREVAFFAADGWLDAPRLIRTALAGAQRLDAEIRERTPVASLRTRGGRVEALVVGDTEVRADAVLVCVGPSTQAFLAPLGVRIPVDRVPGLLAVTSPPADPLSRVIHAPGVHLRPDAAGGLVVGAEDVDAPAASASPAQLDTLAARLLERAVRVMPAARGVKLIDRRVGVRPMPADRHTIAGRIPGFDNAWMIATHSGVTLGPLLGRVLAAEIGGGVQHAALAPFRPDRFTERAGR